MTTLLSLRTYDRQPERYSGFVIKLQFCSKVEAPNGDVLGVLESFDQVFDIPRQLYIDDDEAMEFLLYIFLCRVQIGESFRYAVIDEALGFAHSLVNDVTHAGKEIFRILVDVERRLPGLQESVVKPPFEMVSLLRGRVGKS
ncbi:hypothetical protein RHSIM_Rhsim06G0037600 [Rhododendron simsii]|uniref:Uncharacterized protein n=1 Tax=Rhododendron simsii TaxID=118357 RepID=A0A834GQ84_RHOSS|nr:hypothetical protein RHSIM_Rhsim06G0037600 [Rhododendron simsii]